MYLLYIRISLTWDYFYSIMYIFLVYFGFIASTFGFEDPRAYDEEYLKQHHKDEFYVGSKMNLCEASTS